MVALRLVAREYVAFLPTKGTRGKQSAFRKGGKGRATSGHLLRSVHCGSTYPLVQNMASYKGWLTAPLQLAVVLEQQFCKKINPWAMLQNSGDERNY